MSTKTGVNVTEIIGCGGICFHGRILWAVYGLYH